MKHSTQDVFHTGKHPFPPPPNATPAEKGCFFCDNNEIKSDKTVEKNHFFLLLFSVNPTHNDAPEVKSWPSGRKCERQIRFHLINAQIAAEKAGRGRDDERCCRHALLRRFFVINFSARPGEPLSRPGARRETVRSPHV